MYRYVLFLMFCLCLAVSSTWTEIQLPVGDAPEPIEVSHFPSRMHSFIWRNWPVVPVEKIASILHTNIENIQAEAERMGLPPQDPLPPRYNPRMYITLLRRNWHLLPYEQILQLLDCSAEQLAESLREDDFLYVKLGSRKPACEPIVYTPPTEDTRRRCAEIKRFVQDTFGEKLRKPAEKRFQFIDELLEAPTEPPARPVTKPRFSPRYIYSYVALFGDPLMNPELNPYPDGLLHRLSVLGIDGVWIHTVLRQLAPSRQFPEFGRDHEIRLKHLNELVQRASRYNIGIYLYVNEPRAMPAGFFTNRDHLKGVREGEYHALCTSQPEVLAWMEESLAYVFAQVPGLAGVFTITASENLTHCASHGASAKCSRCKNRAPAELIAEVNSTIERGVHKGSLNAKVIVWDWGWNDAWAEAIIESLPESVWLMSVSEWSTPVERGGVKTEVGEYSISVVGPGPRATRHWLLAKQRGLKTAAKMQINNTWELSAVPYLPVMDLVADHCSRLFAQDVDGLMLSWSLGGYPSPNLKLVQQFDADPSPSRDAVLDSAALAYFGPDGKADARKAWAMLSEAFQEFPYHASVVYRCPLQAGPANPLYPFPTGYPSTMVGFGYDDLDGWRGPYPADVFADQFSKLAQAWERGTQKLRQAADAAPEATKKQAVEQYTFASAAHCHFLSVANQIQFIRIRDRLLDRELPKTETEWTTARESLRKILQSEIETARRLFDLTRADSRIGFEASNQYYYLPVDLIEKAVNCRFIADRIDEFYN